MSRNGPKRRREVQRRARRISEVRGWGYGKSMKMAGWLVAKAANERQKRA